MRMAAIALALLAGCNSIFGLSKTYPIDAIDSPSGPPPHGSISWMQMESHPIDVISFPPITGVRVQTGKLDGTLDDVTWDSDGVGFDMLYHTTDSTYRIVYQVPGDMVPHEVQWDVPTDAKLAVPFFGRLTRTPLPTGSGFTLSPVFMGGAPDDAWPCMASPPAPPCSLQRTGLQVYTTGTWMHGGASYNPNANNHTVTIRSQDLQAWSGTTDIPQTATGDEIWVFHYDSTGRADAYASVAPAALVAGTFVTQNIRIESDPGATSTSGSEILAINTPFQPESIAQDTALQNALGALYHAPTGIEISGGILPDLAMPSMSIPLYTGEPNDSVFIALNTLNASPNGTFTCGDGFANPFTAVELEGDELRTPGIRYRQYTARAAGAAMLSSGYQAVSFKTQSTDCNFMTHQPFPFTVGIAENVTFGMPLLADDTAVTVPTNGFQDLTFALSDGGASTSDCVVTVYRVDSTALVPLRTIQVLAKPTNMTVHVPTSDFTSGAQHAFEIVCRDGYPGAKAGDYRAFGGYPQQESQIFPGTFTVTLQ